MYCVEGNDGLAEFPGGCSPRLFSFCVGGNEIIALLAGYHALNASTWVHLSETQCFSTGGSPQLRRESGQNVPPGKSAVNTGEAPARCAGAGSTGLDILPISVNVWEALTVESFFPFLLITLDYCRRR